MEDFFLDIASSNGIGAALSLLFSLLYELKKKEMRNKMNVNKTIKK